MWGFLDKGLFMMLPGCLLGGIELIWKVFIRIFLYFFVSCLLFVSHFFHSFFNDILRFLVFRLVNSIVMKIDFFCILW
jgi:hypothetical protein